MNILKISEIIKNLAEIKKYHGDLYCIAEDPVSEIGGIYDISIEKTFAFQDKLEAPYVVFNFG